MILSLIGDYRPEALIFTCECMKSGFMPDSLAHFAKVTNVMLILK